MSVNKQKLLDILGHPKDMSDKDLEELENAVQQYPYFQLGYSLIAKAKYDRQTPDAYDSLGVAAVYAPDRSTLKKIFYDNLSIEVKETQSTEEVQTVANTPADVNPEPVEPGESSQVEEIEEDAEVTAQETEEEVSTEVDKDTTPLTAEEEPETITSADQTEVEPETEPDVSKIGDELEITEATSEEPETTTSADQTEVEPETEPDVPKIGGELEITEVTSEEQQISIEKKEEDEAVYRELEENLKNLRENKIKFEDEEEDTESSGKKKTINETVLPENEGENVEIPSSDPQKKTSTESFRRNREKAPSRLITEISSLEPLPSDHIKTKQQNQLSIIDKFINNDPEIIYKDQSSLAEQVSDLSEKSTVIRDHLLTENFAAIMMKQGKLDKAIEIYRKLIWKFPQKKAYFASKVKALKESE